ncbi:glycerol-3-phosphate acyltransferase [Chloroflexota bacterium]
MEVFYSALLVISAFWLGACPFSLWIGRWILGRDIRDYGDGNPGAANVFRAGGRKSGCLALTLDVAKGVPFVVLSHSLFELSEVVVMAIALSAMLGHAFSPLLRFKGGKSIAVTFGVLLALPQHEMLIAFAAFMFLGFLFIEIDAWTVMLSSAGSLAYLITTEAGSSQVLFMLTLLVILGVKHFSELRTVPRLKLRLIHWFQSRERET